MTIRVALESFASYLHENGLGDDEMGIKMTQAYLENIDALRDLIFGYDPRTERNDNVQDPERKDT